MRRDRLLLSGPGLCFAALALALLLAACERERPALEPRVPPAGRIPQPVGEAPFRPGPAEPGLQIRNPYAGDVHAIAEGRRLYGWFNCYGCHFAGGGGIGPAFLDDRWIYGGSSAEVYLSILEGRPNGMPAYAGRISEDQAWKITAYVLSLAGRAREDVGQRPDPEAAPQKRDEFEGMEKEKSRPAGRRSQGGQEPQ